MIQGKVIYINEFGQPDENGKYKVTLQGSFHYNFGTGSWDYDKEIEKLQKSFREIKFRL